MSWNEVGKRDGNSGSGRFVQFEDGKSIRIRLLDEEPHLTRVHKISQKVRKGDKVEEIFRSVPSTDSPDDNYILRNNPKRYPEQRVFNMRGHEFKRGDDGKHSIDGGELKILQGGNAIFNPLKLLYDEHGSLSQFDIVITRKGEGRESEYTVSAAPFPLKGEFNVAEWQAKLAADATLQWENVFPKVTEADQRKIIAEAGFDIAYDPAAALTASMSTDEAGRVKFTFGKFKDKTIGEVFVIDAGYVSWAAENVTSADEVAAACRVMVGKASAIASGQAPAQQSLPAPTAKPLSRMEQAEAAAAVETAKAATSGKEALVEKISDYFEQDPRFSEIPVMVGLIKKHSGSKVTRVKDLNVDQLTALLAEISGE